MTEAEIIRGCWTIGRLRYKLKPLQREIRDFWELTKAYSHQFLGLIGRQTGKTFLWNVTACELAIQNPGSHYYCHSPCRKEASRIY